MATLLTDPDTVPALPGSTFFFQVERQTPLPVSQGSTVFVPITADWGPVGEPRPYDSYAAYTKDFGVTDTVGRRRVFHAFLGEGLPGKGGAGRVIVWRQATAGAARASAALSNMTPAVAITLEGRYPGTRGNAFRLTHRPSGSAGFDELVVIENGREVETYPYAETDVAALAADVNGRSKRIRTTGAVVTGVALADVANVALVGGNDGAVLTVAEWTTMLAALEYEPFSVFAAAGLVDPAIVTTLIAWKEDVKSRGRPIMLAIGGPAAEAYAAHRTRAMGYDDPDVVAFGTGSIADSTLTNDGTEVTISTAEAIARVAGAIARRGELMDMVNVRFTGWRIIAGATRAQSETAAHSGMTLLVRDGDPDAPTKIPLGVTTFQPPSVPPPAPEDETSETPFWVYSNVKFVRTNHGLVADITADQENGDLIGELGVNPRARDTVLGRAKTIVNRRIERTIIQPGSEVIFDPEVETSPTDDFVPLAYDIVYVRGLRAIRNRITVH